MHERSDEDIKKTVADRLYWDRRVDASEVGVTVSRGVVTLRGSLSTHLARAAAQSAAAGVQGAVSVNSDLSVELPLAREEDTDKALRKDVEALIRWYPAVRAEELVVQVVRGLVILEGTVDAAWKKDHLEGLIFHQKNVDDVLADIRVQDCEEVDDATIAALIRTNLDRELKKHGQEIHVLVECGDVSLCGYASTADHREAATRFAQAAPGVRSVTDNLGPFPVEAPKTPEFTLPAEETAPTIRLYP